jgi:hypothetical protein
MTAVREMTLDDQTVSESPLFKPAGRDQPLVNENFPKAGSRRTSVRESHKKSRGYVSLQRESFVWNWSKCGVGASSTLQKTKLSF